MLLKQLPRPFSQYGRTYNLETQQSLNFSAMPWQDFFYLLTNIPLVHEQGVYFSPIPIWTGFWGLYFLDQAFEEVDHGLDSILMETVGIPELYVSFDEPDTMLSSVSSGFLCLVSTCLLIV